jgi:hypothetical protein
MTGDRLVRYLVRHGFAGALAGWLTVGALLASDTAGLGSLLLQAETGDLALAMLLAFFGLTFASAAMGAAIMSLGRPPAAGGRLGFAGGRDNARGSRARRCARLAGGITRGWGRGHRD